MKTLAYMILIPITRKIQLLKVQFITVKDVRLMPMEIHMRIICAIMAA